MEPDEPIDFDLSVNDVVNKVIMNSVNFKEVFTDLDASSDCVEILLSPDDPYFLITTFGICGDCQVGTFFCLLDMYTLKYGLVIPVNHTMYLMLEKF